MASTKKTILKEIFLWKKRLNDSKKVLSNVYDDVAKDLKKGYKEVTK